VANAQDPQGTAAVIAKVVVAVPHAVGTEIV
jgi:hypothetical protein